MDDAGGVYARLRLPTWPETSARAVEAHAMQLSGCARHLWARARSLALGKVCIRAAACLLGLSPTLERLLHIFANKYIYIGSHVLDRLCSQGPGVCP